MGGSRAGEDQTAGRVGREVVAGQEAGQSRDVSRRNQRGCYLDNLSWEPWLSLPYTMLAPWLLGVGGISDWDGWCVCTALSLKHGVSTALHVISILDLDHILTLPCWPLGAEHPS